MPNVKISDLSAASTPLSGTEELPIVQSGTTVKATAQDVADLASSFSVENGGNSPQIIADVFSSRPLSTLIGTIFIATDTYQMYRYNGSNWDLIGGSSLLTTKVTLSSADILSFTGSNFIELIPAQGAGTYINVLKAFYVYNYGTVAYSGGGTAWITMGGLVANITAATSNVFTQVQTSLIRPQMYNSALITNIYDDTSVEFGCSAVQTLGDGTLDVYLTYEIINL